MIDKIKSILEKKDNENESLNIVIKKDDVDSFSKIKINENIKENKIKILPIDKKKKEEKSKNECKENNCKEKNKENSLKNITKIVDNFTYNIKNLKVFAFVGKSREPEKVLMLKGLHLKME